MAFLDIGIEFVDALNMLTHFAITDSDNTTIFKNIGTYG